jgi:hypothetical protein
VTLAFGVRAVARPHAELHSVPEVVDVAATARRSWGLPQEFAQRVAASALRRPDRALVTTRAEPGLAQTRQYLLVPIWLNGKTAVMTKSIEDILVCIHDEPDHNEYTSWGE